MKKFNTLYYLLFILLIMGAFASMAQNSYGLNIMGGVAFIFGILFLIQLYFLISKKGKKDVLGIAELAGLFVLTVLLGFRIFYIYFPYVEYVFSLAGILLMFVYLRKMFLRFNEIGSKNKLLSILIILFHVSIILFLISLVLVPFAPKAGEFAGIGGFVLLLIFIVTGFAKKELLVDGNKVSAFSTVTHFKDHSIVIVTLFLLFSLYVGLKMIGVLPGIYSDEFPQAYFKLVEDASSRKEKPVDGKYKFEEFKKKYDDFLNDIEKRDLKK